MVARRLLDEGAINQQLALGEACGGARARAEPDPSLNLTLGWMPTPVTFARPNRQPDDTAKMRIIIKGGVWKNTEDEILKVSPVSAFSARLGGAPIMNARTAMLTAFDPTQAAISK